jgi:MFS family permease
MWFIPLMFFAYQFILRLWPGLMMQQIMHQLSIDATLFGTLAASYYYGYSLMQIPVAILLDRYGARIIVCIFAILCGAASIAFFYTHNYYIALGSRFLIGVGSAAGFLGVSKVTSEWFDRSSYAKMIGLSFTFGLTGAIFGGKPVGLLMERYSSESVAVTLGIVSMVIGIFALLFLRSSNRNSTPSDERLNLYGLKSIITSKTIWILAISNALLVGSLEGFADVWGVPYLVTAYSIEKNDAALMVSFVFFGMLLGGPVLSWLNTKIKEHATIAASGITMTVLMVAILYNVTPQHVLPYLFFLVGMACCYQVIVFALGSKMVSHKNTGICVAFLNSINMLGGSFYHTTIGMAMDAFWGGIRNVDGERLYELETYKYALSIILIGAVAGSVMVTVLCYLGSKVAK